MKNLAFITLIISSFAIFSACTANRPQNKLGDNDVRNPPETKAVHEVLPHKGVLEPRNCVCVQLWLPVCGENGKTYSNACFADCAGVKYKQGPCNSVITE